MKIQAILLALLPLAAFGDDLDSALEVAAPSNQPVEATFKSLRVVQSQSVETTHQGVLNFTISHRFGPAGTGPGSFFGLDFARIRLGLDYGITDWTDAGIERSNNDGNPVDLFLKQRLLRQTTSGNIPLSLTWYSAGYVMTDAQNGAPFNLPFVDRLSSTHQLIVARKFSEDLSLQIAPTLVTREFRPFDADKPVSAGVEIGGRYKLTSRFALTAEAAPMFYGVANTWTPAFAGGVDIETGGHVFQLFLSNSAWLSEDRMYTQTSGGNLALSFNITRGFDL
ncbi:MAG TPA: DUF5777 family beta-barrel protein [Fibrobacteria bacterium]|nr:DUF5777 family beta-barrel protein [Fibrobacteria bacterium]